MNKQPNLFGEPDPEPRPGPGEHPNSRAAYERSKEYRDIQQMKILRVIEAAAASGNVGLACFEVEAITGLTHQSASAAINRLHHVLQWIESAGINRMTPRNRRAEVYRPRRKGA